MWSCAASAYNHLIVHTHNVPDWHRDGRSPLQLALLLTVAFACVEGVGGLVAGSLALIADAAHMLTDALSLGLALLAMWLAPRAGSREHTFGFRRSEVLAALLNGVGLWALAAWLLFEAYRRFMAPGQVDGAVVIAVGVAGLAINLTAAVLLRRERRGSLNVEGAFLHIVGDALGSVGVVVAGVLVAAFGWRLADPIVAALIAALIVGTSVSLVRRVLHVLMEGTPAHLDLQALCSRLEAVPEVTGVHDIHAWTLTSGYDVLSAHVTTGVTEPARRQALLTLLREAAGEFGISHTTIQVEDTADACAAEAHHTAHR